MMDALEQAAKNWDSIVVGLVIAAASGEKLGLVLISTIKNLREAWRTAFPKADRWDCKD